MLDRLLDRLLLDEEKKHPLKLPPKEKYRFSVPDSDKNIIFDKDNVVNHSIIKVELVAIYWNIYLLMINYLFYS